MTNLKKDTYFVNSKNEVFFLEKGTPSSFIQSDFKEIKESEVEELKKQLEELKEQTNIKSKYIVYPTYYYDNSKMEKLEYSFIFN